MKPLIQTSDSILGGRSVTFNVDLKETGVQGEFIVDCLGFSKASVEVFCSSGSGVSGSGGIKQRNRAGGTGFELSPAATIDFTEGSVEGQFGLEVSGRYLYLDTSAVSFGDEGRVTVIFCMKL